MKECRGGVVVGASDFQTCQMLYNLSRREGGGREDAEVEERD